MSLHEIESKFVFIRRLQLNSNELHSASSMFNCGTVEHLIKIVAFPMRKQLRAPIAPGDASMTGSRWSQVGSTSWHRSRRAIVKCIIP
jgi:hypothetical protein